MHLKKLFFTAITALSASAMADIKPARLFSDNMVIQRETKAPVWGWADAGEEISVSGSWGEVAKTTTNAQGKWMVKLPTPKAGGPFTLTFKGKNTIVRKNVLAGDVWLCSGQSNMAWTVGQAMNPDKEAKAANFPLIRHFAVTRNSTQQEAKDCQGNWAICSESTVKTFSATAYFTGRELHKSLNVPIGLINSSWGGTRIESWTNEKSQGNDDSVQALLNSMKRWGKNYNKEKAQRKLQEALVDWKKKKEKAQVENKKAPRRPRLQADPLKNANFPSNLFRGMINPLIPYAIKGATWYQGESNAKTHQQAQHYRVQLDRMINNWRNLWKQDIPFYFVQLPNYRKAQTQALESADIWPVIRDSFFYVNANTANTGMATTIDIGEARNIHPINKQEVGRRMASTILNQTYAIKTPTSPLYKSHKIDGDKIIVSFGFSGSGLLAKDAELKTFDIAGADKIF
ncbi:MAG: sialate O-acetylesterase, partial [Lentisphaeraceae bacterium]|nr:sialate O-acetylesterase [Lentisphaeraceae bacterium]